MSAEERAKKIVSTWMTEQLRDEGREAIYVDDEVGLMCDIAQAIEQAVAEEREACARVCEKYSNEKYQEVGSGRYTIAANICAELIRARGGQ